MPARRDLPFGGDPADEFHTPYAYGPNNPVNGVDPDGRVWTDDEGTVFSEEQLKQVDVFIFYDPEAFESQAMEQYYEAIKIYGYGHVALSSATNEQVFVEDWGNISGNNVKEVVLQYHGNNQALFLSSKNGEYIVSTETGKTNISLTPGIDVKNLPQPKGDISNARLSVYSCSSASDTQNPIKSGYTLLESFARYHRFNEVMGTAGGLSYIKNPYKLDYKHPYPNNNEWIIYKKEKRKK